MSLVQGAFDDQGTLGGVLQLDTLRGANHSKLERWKLDPLWERVWKRVHSGTREDVLAFWHELGADPIDYATNHNKFVNQGLEMISNLLAAGGAAVPTKIQLGTDSTAHDRTQSGCIAAITTGGLAEIASTASQQTQDSTNDTFQLLHSFTATSAFSTPNGPKEACMRSATPKALNRLTYAERVLAINDVLVATFRMKLVP